ncbi:TPA: hypothetical protein ACX6PQ_003857 [Photobacterium damselae]
MSSFILAIYPRIQLNTHALQTQRIQTSSFQKAHLPTNYVEDNQSLRDQGRIDIWLSDDIIDNW